MTYTKTTWVNGKTPALNASNLNNIEQGIKDVHDKWGKLETVENLSGTTGNYDGEVKMDDGTNTPARMTPCVWDDVNSVWRPVNSPSTGAFT